MTYTYDVRARNLLNGIVYCDCANDKTLAEKREDAMKVFVDSKSHWPVFRMYGGNGGLTNRFVTYGAPPSEAGGHFIAIEADSVEQLTLVVRAAAAAGVTAIDMRTLGAHEGIWVDTGEGYCTVPNGLSEAAKGA